jgi:N-acetylmuramoyl-L-alanine amidase
MGCCRPLLLALLATCTLSGASPTRGAADLTFHRDAHGAYASYVLRDGETVWTHVVRRFTSRTDDVSDTEAVARVLERSGIEDATRIRPNSEIRIPVELLADEYRQQDNAAEQAAKPLAGVVVILDAGHGGTDTGARGRDGIYEDEVVYDVMCRVKRILERETDATVYATIRDRSRGFAVTAKRTDFPRDRDEYIQTTPPYLNIDSTVGVHLRWYLANSLYAAARRQGIAPDRVIFTSFHADDLASDLRGATIYIPGARFCRGLFGKRERTYQRFAEVRERPQVAFTERERESSEQLSRAFAEAFVGQLHKARIKVFPTKPIRDCIVRRSAFVPAVLRYNAVPTKVLIECGNLSNVRDRRHLGDPTFRERFARAYVAALIAATSDKR